MAIINTTNGLEAAFNAMKQQRVIIARNFKCCMGCASAELDHIMKVRESLDLHPAGAIYWHKQDNSAARRSGKLYLRYGGRGDTTTKDLAEVFTSHLRANGVRFEWDGSVNSCIVIDLESQ